MLGDRDGGGAGGFAVLDARTFEVKGRWENGGERPPLNYDFWYQPRKNVLISSEFGEPNAYEKGFDIEDVGAGRYGQRIHFWDLAERRLEQTIDLGEPGLVPLEVRWLHDPEAEERLRRRDPVEQHLPLAPLERLMGGRRGDLGRQRRARRVAAAGRRAGPDHRPASLSMDDRFLYLSNWLHGDLRQYDISDPANPRLTGRLWLGGLLGKPNDAGRDLSGGPQMIQLSLRRAQALRHQLALLDLGQPVLSRAALVAAASELLARGRDGGRPGLLRRLPRPTRRSRASPRGAPPGRRLHNGDLPMIAGPSRTSAASPSRRRSGPPALRCSWGSGWHGRSCAPFAGCAHAAAHALRKVGAAQHGRANLIARPARPMPFARPCDAPAWRSSASPRRSQDRRQLTRQPRRASGMGEVRDPRAATPAPTSGKPQRVEAPAATEARFSPAIGAATTKSDRTDRPSRALVACDPQGTHRCAQRPGGKPPGDAMIAAAGRDASRSPTVLSRCNGQARAVASTDRSQLRRRARCSGKKNAPLALS